MTGIYGTVSMYWAHVHVVGALMHFCDQKEWGHYYNLGFKDKEIEAKRNEVTW